jgi:hypothetical protein
MRQIPYKKDEKRQFLQHPNLSNKDIRGRKCSVRHQKTTVRKTIKKTP